MPNFTRRLGTTHQCNIVKGSDSCLPKLAPQANKIKRWIREFRKQLMVSTDDSNSKFFFRSRAAIFQERKRHMRASRGYIIHPFSKFCIKREAVLCILWLFVFFKDPFTTAYYSNTLDDIKHSSWKIIDLTVDIIVLLNSGICFITGKYAIQTKEVVLDQKKIIKQYLMTYFIFDFFGTIPFHYVVAMFSTPTTDYEPYFTLAACLHFLRFVRIKTTMEFFQKITETLEFEDTSRKIIILVLLSFYCLHWWSCMIYIIPKIRYGLSLGNLPNTSWVVMTQIQPSAQNITVGRRYIECLLTTFCHFYRAGIGMQTTEEPIEQIMFSILMITGIFFNAYVIVVVLQMVRSANSSESKYEELVNQLEEYMRKKKLPQNMRNRLLLYYENRFQKHYFKEQHILNTLSEHLRYEIFLHSCKGLVEKVALFQGLSKSTVGSIVGCLKHEVFLPNDIIMKANSTAECIYFISYGTVAYITSSGKEFCHLEDGDHFGEISFFLTESNKYRLGNVVALEITEVFKLNQRDLNHCMFQDEEVGERLEKVAADRLAQMEAVEKEEIYDEGKRRRDVLYELRKGRILEHSHRKRRRENKPAYHF